MAGGGPLVSGTLRSSSAKALAEVPIVYIHYKTVMPGTRKSHAKPATSDKQGPPLTAQSLLSSLSLLFSFPLSPRRRPTAPLCGHWVLCVGKLSFLPLSLSSSQLWRGAPLILELKRCRFLSVPRDKGHQYESVFALLGFLEPNVLYQFVEGYEIYVTSLGKVSGSGSVGLQVLVL